MLNKEQHQLIMGRILKDVYTDTSIAPLLGLKGGTCAYIFYDLPRFSVDLDFDLLKSDEETQAFVFDKIANILKKYGIIKEKRIKRFTIFLLLSYGDTDHNIKIEINTRKLLPNNENYYELKEYLGISILSAKKEYIFANKLVALTQRKETAMRDVYDIYYFTEQNWELDADIIKIRTNKNVKKYLVDCIAVIEKIKDNQTLHGIGELINEKEKTWIRQNLKAETIFLLKNYISVLK